jgi:hypothetical protein
VQKSFHVLDGGGEGAWCLSGPFSTRQMSSIVVGGGAEAGFETEDHLRRSEHHLYARIELTVGTDASGRCAAIRNRSTRSERRPRLAGPRFTEPADFFAFDTLAKPFFWGEHSHAPTTRLSGNERLQAADHCQCDPIGRFLVEGTQPNLKKIRECMERSLMPVTALAPMVGYDKASKIAHYACWTTI